VASDALRETFPFAATSAEQVINSRDFNEAQRQIDLLAKADPTNFTLTILRSKLDAQRKLLDKQQQQDGGSAEGSAGGGAESRVGKGRSRQTGGTAEDSGSGSRTAEGTASSRNATAHPAGCSSKACD
jgi:protein TonB